MITKNKKTTDIKKLDSCDCPVCKVNSDQLWDDWKARAIHNDHVMKKERELAESLIDVGQEQYEKYLEEIYKKSSLNYLWQYIKMKKKYNGISSLLFGKK